MIWKKLGFIFCAEKQNESMYFGGRAPIARYLSGDLFEIYFASYDKNMCGSIFRLIININNPKDILELNTTPIITKGRIGYYDDNGIIPSSIIDIDDKIYLYTIGFSLKNKIIFDASSGLAISDNGGESFEKINGPILDRGIDDPCFAASPNVLFDKDRYKMWFVSCDKWETLEDGSHKHYYNIKYKESEDGIVWDVRSKICIDYENQFEYAISRPSVIVDGENDYKMWYSFRAQENIETYRIGYAESEDGISWVRKDHLMAHFDVSEVGFDSDMLCYPHVFDHMCVRYMLYNGNGYGRTGFGIAKMNKV